ncbi:uncharacterized protein [Drosophila takahashii]|uniref:uncharacterized protein n=1 Tax=Drosophila takahashii TaxID=29030 RepID=UPI001CF89AA8|nr:uncharacterized protein LOC108062282 [Drosophila takahashii]
MDVKQQMQDVNQDRGKVATVSKDLELELEHAEDLSRNSSLTTVCSTFPLTSRIDSYHRWHSEIGVNEGEEAEDIMNRQLEVEGERKVQLAIAMPLAIEAIHP